MEKATHLATSVEGLTISIGNDGLWLNFSADGKHASINLSLYAAQHKGDIISSGILAWCKKTALHYVGEQDKPLPFSEEAFFKAKGLL